MKDFFKLLFSKEKIDESSSNLFIAFTTLTMMIVMGITFDSSNFWLNLWHSLIIFPGMFIVAIPVFIITGIVVCHTQRQGLWLLIIYIALFLMVVYMRTIGNWSLL